MGDCDTMDKIILCFDLNNYQADFSYFMQVVQGFEEKNIHIQLIMQKFLRKFQFGIVGLKKMSHTIIQT